MARGRRGGGRGRGRGRQGNRGWLAPKESKKKGTKRKNFTNDDDSKHKNKRRCDERRTGSDEEDEMSHEEVDNEEDEGVKDPVMELLGTFESYPRVSHAICSDDSDEEESEEEEEREGENNAIEDNDVEGAQDVTDESVADEGDVSSEDADEGDVSNEDSGESDVDNEDAVVNGDADENDVTNGYADEGDVTNEGSDVAGEDDVISEDADEGDDSNEDADGSDEAAVAIADANEGSDAADEDNVIYEDGDDVDVTNEDSDESDEAAVANGDADEGDVTNEGSDAADEDADEGDVTNEDSDAADEDADEGDVSNEDADESDVAAVANGDANEGSDAADEDDVIYEDGDDVDVTNEDSDESDEAAVANDVDVTNEDSDESDEAAVANGDADEGDVTNEGSDAADEDADEGDVTNEDSDVADEDADEDDVSNEDADESDVAAVANGDANEGSDAADEDDVIDEDGDDVEVTNEDSDAADEDADEGDVSNEDADESDVAAVANGDADEDDVSNGDADEGDVTNEGSDAADEDADVDDVTDEEAETCSEGDVDNEAAAEDDVSNEDEEDTEDEETEDDVTTTNDDEEEADDDVSNKDNIQAASSKMSFDHYGQHFNQMLSKSFVEQLGKKESWITKTESWPILGPITKTFLKPNLDLSVKRPKNIKIIAPSTKLERLSLIEPLAEGWINANPNTENECHLTDFQRELFSVMNSYSDLLYCRRTHEISEDLRATYCLHILNHCVKARHLVSKNNLQLKKHDDVPDEFRDQGLTCPKVLVLVPTRDSAFRIVHKLIDIFCANSAYRMEEMNRFDVEFQLMEEEPTDKKSTLPRDYHEAFAGNIHDDFHVGIAINKTSMAIYKDFNSADILLASPLGLRKIVGAKGEIGREYDFLSSIEIVVIDSAEMLLMQNWEHLTHLLEHVHKRPKESHDIDIFRVRSWVLEGWCKQYRQTMCFSGVACPEVYSIFTRFCCNYAGIVKTIGPNGQPAITQIVVPLPQVFQRFESSSALDDANARFDCFITRVFPQFNDASMTRTMIFISSYFDYVRVRNYFRRQDINFTQICEYTPNDGANRARSSFVKNLRRNLLYTERAHFYQRYRIKGIRNIIFYQLPVLPQLYNQVCNLTQLQEKFNLAEKNFLTCTVMYSKYDAHRLAAVVGTERATQMMSPEKNVFMFVTDENQKTKFK